MGTYRLILAVGRNTYLRGKGIMHGKLFGIVTLARSQGRETDPSEFAKYLNVSYLAGGRRFGMG